MRTQEPTESAPLHIILPPDLESEVAKAYADTKKLPEFGLYINLAPPANSTIATFLARGETRSAGLKKMILAASVTMKGKTYDVYVSAPSRHLTDFLSRLSEIEGVQLTEFQDFGHHRKFA